MLIVKLFVGLVFFSLAGCTVAPEKEEPVAERINVTPDEIPVEKLTEISPDVMYLLMAAEIAGQRNQYGVALDGYLEAAKRVDDVRVVERAAKIGLYVKDSKKTSEAASLWLKLDGANLTARKIAVLSALKSDQKEEAVQHLSQMLQDDPAGFEGAVGELAQLMKKDGKADFIYDVLEGVSEAQPDKAIIPFIQAKLAGQMNKIDLAKNKSKKAVQLQPDWDKALILHAQLSAQTKEYEKAVADLEKVLENSPENNKVRKILGQVLMKTNELDKAVDVYQNVLEIDEDDEESLFAIAMIDLQLEKEEEAKQYLKKLVNRQGWDPQACFYLGRIAFKNEEYKEAVVWFDKVTKGPYRYEATMAALSVLLEQEDYDAVEKRLKEVLITFPEKKVNVLLFKAEVFTKQKNHQKAFDILSEGLNEFSGQRDLLYGRALVAEKLNKLDLLETDLKTVLKQNPEDIAVLNALGYTLVDRTTRFSEAEIYLEKALKLNPKSALIMDSVGWLRFKQGQMEKALVLLRAAYKIQAEHEIAAHLAEALIHVGEKAEAKAIIRDALKKSPQNDFLLKFKAKFPYIND